MSEKQLKLAGFEAENASSPAEVADNTGNGVPPPVSPVDEITSALREPTSIDSSAGVVAGQVAWLIDSHSLIYQVFHALPEMSSPSGMPVGAVHGFIRDVVDILDLKRPDYLVCVFDAPGDNFRHELYTDYKVHRESMPDDLSLQIPNIYRLLHAMGVCCLAIPGYEADDVLATLSTQIERSGGECFLVTSDKDCRQLIGDRVRMFNIRKQEAFDSAALMQVWGVRPEQVVDFQALVGDSVDNVPGVPLIGPKAAQDLLGKYQTLEGVYEHLHELKGKRKENLETFKEQAFLSRQLVQLDRGVPLESFDWSQARPGRYRGDEIHELCREFGFRQLATRVMRLAGMDGTLEQAASAGNSRTRPAQDSSVQSSERSGETVELTDDDLPPGMSAPRAELDLVPWVAEYQAVTSLEQLRELATEMLQQECIVLDTETTSVMPRWAEIVGLSFAWKEGVAWYVPVRAPADEVQLPLPEVLDILRPVFTDPKIAKVGQNIKYDSIVLRCAGVDLAGIAFDTMVADYLLDPGERTHGIDDLARKYLAHQTITIDTLIGKGKNQKRMDDVPLAQITPYAAEDADVPFRLKRILGEHLQEQGLENLFQDLEMPLIEVLAELEFNGIAVDRQRLQELSAGFGRQIEQLESEIYVEVGHEFNIDSRQQLGKILFDQLKLPILKRTTTGPSTDAEVLEELALRHPLPAKIVQYRQNSKLKSTYTDSLPLLIHPQTGRVHTSFKQDVAATGRLSSQDPNLQNIPIRTNEGRAIRSAFVPGHPGWQLMTADYSQIELRVLAHFSGDETLRQAFAADQDIHALVAAEVYNVPLAEVTREQRRNAKAVNFGVIYGQSAFGLAKSLGIDKGEAARFIDAYFSKYPGVDEFMLQTLRSCRELGYVSTISGRRRPVSGVRDPSKMRDQRQRNLPERIAVNTVIQGSAADIIKRAMINIYRQLRTEGFSARMLLQIHDELVFEFPPDEKERLAATVTAAMTSAAQLLVPLKVDVKTGNNWAECELMG